MWSGYHMTCVWTSTITAGQRSSGRVGLGGTEAEGGGQLEAQRQLGAAEGLAHAQVADERTPAPGPRRPPGRAGPRARRRRRRRPRGARSRSRGRRSAPSRRSAGLDPRPRRRARPGTRSRRSVDLGRALQRHAGELAVALGRVDVAERRAAPPSTATGRCTRRAGRHGAVVEVAAVRGRSSPTRRGPEAGAVPRQPTIGSTGSTMPSPKWMPSSSMRQVRPSGRSMRPGASGPTCAWAPHQPSGPSAMASTSTTSRSPGRAPATAIGPVRPLDTLGSGRPSGNETAGLLVEQRARAGVVRLDDDPLAGLDVSRGGQRRRRTTVSGAARDERRRPRPGSRRLRIEHDRGVVGPADGDRLAGAPARAGRGR